jgi:hypothetical protein
MVKNWLIIVLVAFTAILLIFFLLKKNQKDKKALIEKLDNDYRLPVVDEPKS